MPYTKNLGFIEDPFAYTNADEEEKLTSYFVNPPYFESVTGDSKSPSPCVVLAPRGAGKSAQRRMTEDWALKNKVLPVTYDRFEFSEKDKLSNISLNYHLRNIITRVLTNLIIFASQNPNKIKQLPKAHRKILNISCHNYLGDMTGRDIQETIKKFRSFPQKIKEFWNTNIGFLDSLLNFLLKTFELEKIDLPSLKQEEKKLSSSYKYQLEILYEIAKELGFDSIYILIDKVDETELTGNNAENSFRLIESLIKDLDILSLEGYGFKFFLWDKIYPFFKEAARPDRVKQYSLNWTRPQLKEMLKERLKAFSNEAISSMNSISEELNENDVDDIVTIMSWYSPRNVIRFCQEIIAEQFQINPDSKKISLRAIELASLKYSEKLANEQYKRDTLRNLKKIDKELFSINHLSSNIYKSSSTDGRNKVIAFEKNGAIKKVGKEKISSSNKPVNLYSVVDPRINRIINSSYPIDKFIKDRLIKCNECNRESLIDIRLINTDCEIHCWNCDVELFSFSSDEEISSTEINSITNQIRQNVSTSELKEAIELIILNFQNNKEIYEEAIILSSNLNRIDIENRLSLSTSEDYNRNRNRIAYAILEIIRRIES